MAPRFGVGFTEVTLDLALNREADVFLTTQAYSATYTFAVRVESVELNAAANEEAPFGLPPSVYVAVEHGGVKRFSPVRRKGSSKSRHSRGHLHARLRACVPVRLCAAHCPAVRRPACARRRPPPHTPLAAIPPRSPIPSRNGALVA